MSARPGDYPSAATQIKTRADTFSHHQQQQFYTEQRNDEPTMQSNKEYPRQEVVLITDYSSSEAEAKTVVPLLCLDVNLGHGLSPQLIINEGDDPLQVANDFANKYCKSPMHLQSFLELGDQKKQRLLQAIEE